MTDKALASQIDAGPLGAVLNVYRLRPGVDEPAARFTPRSLDEHDHPTMQVSVLLRDSIAAVGWQTGGGKAAGRRLRGGQTYVVPPDQPHDFRLYRPQGMVNFHITRDALMALNPALRIGSRVLDELAVLEDSVTTGLASGVYAACLEPDGLTPLYLDAAWTMLVVHLARGLRSQAGSERGAANQLPKHQLSRALDFIKAHLGDNGLNVSQIAECVALSPVHFTRRFTQAMGQSPMQFIIGQRLDQAQRLLLADTMSIVEIAYSVGYGSHARFTEAFRRRCGLTPSEVRQGRPFARPDAL